MEPLLFYAFPMTFRTQLALGLLTHIPPIAITAWIGRHGPLAPREYLDVLGAIMLVVVYLPILACILMLPNANPAHASAAGRLPAPEGTTST